VSNGLEDRKQVDKLYDGALTVSGFPFLEFDLAPIDRIRLRGFALGWNSEITLLHVMDNGNFRLNGYAVFRNSDVKRWRSIRADDFLARALREKFVTWAGCCGPVSAQRQSSRFRPRRNG
jgi:hypothetical protein